MEAYTTAVPREPRPIGWVPPTTARECLLNGLRVFVDDGAALIVIGFVMVIIGAVTPVFVLSEEPQFAWAVLFYLFVAFPLEVGFSFICLRAVRGGEVKLEHFFEVTTQYKEIVLAGIFTTALIIGGLGLFVLPGIYFYCKMRFVPYLLLEDGLDARSAMQESFRLTKGHLATLLLINLVGSAAWLLGGLLLLLGLAPALVWWQLGLASLYHGAVTAPNAWSMEDQESREEAAEEQRMFREAEAPSSKSDGDD